MKEFNVTYTQDEIQELIIADIKSKMLKVEEDKINFVIEVRDSMGYYSDWRNGSVLITAKVNV